MTRVVLFLLALAVLLLLFVRFGKERRREMPRPEPTPTARSTPTPGRVEPPTAGPEARRFRLAGVAVARSGGYAVVEDPRGRTVLYRVGEEVPGLGKLVRVEERRAFFRGPEGDLVMEIRPAPTPTAAPAGSPPKLRTPSPSPAGTVPGSLP
ncbi:MAG: hypothetical protein KatS3mg076_1922 [Candidatus Binatia bacterium]|nr:MAG: hypothetical protein KatS3mg076_1922 [Candidatus Binatia bacterium]